MAQRKAHYKMLKVKDKRIMLKTTGEKQLAIHKDLP